MNITQRAIAVFVLLSLFGCSSEIEIVGPGGGVILRIVAVPSEEEGEPPTIVTKQCPGDCKQVDTGAVNNFLIPIPAAGSKFEGWSACTLADNGVCFNQFSAETSAANRGNNFVQTAQFGLKDSNDLTGIWNGILAFEGEEFPVSCVSPRQIELFCTGILDETVSDLVSLTLYDTTVSPSSEFREDGILARTVNGAGPLSNERVQIGPSSLVAADRLFFNLGIEGVPATLDVFFDQAYVVPLPAGFLSGTQEISGYMNGPITGSIVIDQTGFANVELQHDAGGPNCAFSGPLEVSREYTAAYELFLTDFQCPEYLDLDAGLVTDAGLSFTIWGRSVNATEHETVSTGFPTVGGSAGIFGYRNQPRVYGVTITKDF